MRIALLPGIWPPDVGGPATHGPDLARFLVERGHEVHVVTMGDGEPAELPCPVETVSRTHRFPVRYSLVAVRGTQAARWANVVYASATYAASAAAATAARRPLVAKLVSDPAYERAHRYGLASGTLEEFQSARGAGISTLKLARTAALRSARTIVVPSRYLAEFARGWGLDSSRIVVVPNAAPEVPELDGEVEPGTFVFAGRLTRQKALETALEAVASVEGARIRLVGDGPERGSLERCARHLGLDGRAVFVGAVPREEVLRELRTATASVLSSDWENFPHAVVEALAVGTPVVATAVGGVPEVVRDGENGLLVSAGRPEELAGALRRVLEEPGLRDRLSEGARRSLAGFGRADLYGRVERILQEAAR